MGIHYQDRDIIVYKTSCGPYDNNSYLLICRKTGESTIIDTPEHPGAVIEQAIGTNVRAILITHNHMDHLAGFDTVFSAYNVPVRIGSADGDALDGKGITEWISDSEDIHVGKLLIRPLHTPGHTPGSTCYAISTEQGENTLLFSGDTLFPGGPGKSGSPELFLQEVRSITGRLFPLPDKTAVFPGHGDDTTIGSAKYEYGIFATKQHADDLHGNVSWLED